MTSIVAYYRVSTQRQGVSGLGLDAQRAAVREYAKRRKMKIIAEYREVESGAKAARPQLAAAVEQARATGSTLVVAKLDRLARDTRMILDLVDTRLPIMFLDFPESDPSTSTGRLVLTVIAAVAEFERRRISERITAALAQRKARGLRHRGVHDSKRRLSAACRAAGEQRRKASATFRAKVMPAIAAARAKRGGTLERACDRLNARGITTFTGRKWTVANLEAFISRRNCR